MTPAVAVREVVSREVAEEVEVAACREVAAASMEAVVRATMAKEAAVRALASRVGGAKTAAAWEAAWEVAVVRAPVA